LLQDYPPERLRIVEGIRPSHPDLRLPGVIYDEFPFEFLRLLSTRFGFYYASYLHLTARLRKRFVRAAIREFQPEAILSIAYCYSWVTAKEVAAELGVPLHFVIHDAWTDADGLPWPIRKLAVRQFESTYKSAATRMCVSSYMSEFYQRAYEASALVIPPSRPVDMPYFCSPPNRPEKRRRPVFAFAGSISNHNYVKSLASFASVLDRLGADLLIYSQMSEIGFQKFGLNRGNVGVRPLVPCQRLVEVLREEADVLFVPMSFSPEDRRNMEIAFPTKLADYTASGLPMLIWGPAYCSAVKWAREHGGVAAIVDSNVPEDLEIIAQRLIADESYRGQLGRQALTVGDSFFSHSRIRDLFQQAVALQS
jgi:hypothetical protein